MSLVIPLPRHVLLYLQFITKHSVQPLRLFEIPFSFLLRSLFNCTCSNCHFRNSHPSCSLVFYLICGALLTEQELVSPMPATGPTELLLGQVGQCLGQFGGGSGQKVSEVMAGGGGSLHNCTHQGPIPITGPDPPQEMVVLRWCRSE